MKFLQSLLLLTLVVTASRADDDDSGEFESDEVTVISMPTPAAIPYSSRRQRPTSFISHGGSVSGFSGTHQFSPASVGPVQTFFPGMFTVSRPVVSGVQPGGFVSTVVPAGAISNSLQSPQYGVVGFNQNIPTGQNFFVGGQISPVGIPQIAQPGQIQHQVVGVPQSFYPGAPQGVANQGFRSPVVAQTPYFSQQGSFGAGVAFGQPGVGPVHPSGQSFFGGSAQSFQPGQSAQGFVGGQVNAVQPTFSQQPQSSVAQVGAFAQTSPFMQRPTFGQNIPVGQQPGFQYQNNFGQPSFTGQPTSFPQGGGQASATAQSAGFNQQSAFSQIPVAGSQSIASAQSNAFGQSPIYAQVPSRQQSVFPQSSAGTQSFAQSSAIGQPATFSQAQAVGQQTFGGQGFAGQPQPLNYQANGAFDQQIPAGQGQFSAQQVASPGLDQQFNSGANQFSDQSLGGGQAQFSAQQGGLDQSFATGTDQFSPVQGVDNQGPQFGALRSDVGSVDAQPTFDVDYSSNFEGQADFKTDVASFSQDTDYGTSFDDASFNVGITDFS